MVNGKLSEADNLKLYSAVLNMAGGFNRVVGHLKSERARLKELQDKLDGYEASQPTGRGDGGGKPPGGKRELSPEDQLDAIANRNAAMP
jgi:hypothetical protein